MTPQQPFASPNPGMSPATPPVAPPAPNPVPPAANPFVQPQVDPFSNANSIQMAPEPVFPAPQPTPAPVTPQPLVANPAMVTQPMPAPMANPAMQPIQPMAQPVVAPTVPPTQPISPMQPMVEPVPPVEQPITQPAPQVELPVAQPAAQPVPLEPVQPVAPPPVVPEPAQPIVPPQMVEPVQPIQPMAQPVVAPTVSPAQPVAEPTQPVSPLQPMVEPVPPVEQPIAQPAPQVEQPVVQPVAEPVAPEMAQPVAPQPAPAPMVDPAQAMPMAPVAEPAPAAPIVEQAPVAAADPALMAQPVAPQMAPEMAQPMPAPMADPAQVAAMPTDVPQMTTAPEPEAEQPMGAVDLEAELSPEEMAEVTTEAEKTEPVTQKVTQSPTIKIDESVVEAPAAIPPMGLMSEPTKKSKLPLIAGIILILAIAGTAVYFLFFGEKKEDLAVLDDTTILLPEKGGDEGKAAVFNYVTGEKITDFVYNDGSGFVGGYAQVTNAEGKDGIINNKGEMMVDFGTFDSIRSRGALYAARKGDDYSIITADGSKVTSVKESDKVFGAYEGVYFTVVRRNDNQNDIYTIQGKKIDSFETDQELSFRQEGNLVSISYPGKMITLDNKGLKVLKKYEYDSGKNFGVFDTSDKSDLVILTTVNSFEDDQNKKIEYGVISGDQVYDLSDSCTSLSFMKTTKITNLYNDGGVVVCSKENEINKHYSYSIVRSDGSLQKLDTNNSYSFTSENDYIIAHGAGILGNSNKIEFYQGGSVAKTLTGTFGLVTFDQGNVSVYDGINKKTTLYDKVGEQIIQPDVGSAIIYGPYENDTFVINAISDNYLADKEGRHLSSSYNNLYSNGCSSFVAWGYRQPYYDGKYVLLDSAGKEVTAPGDYNRFTCLDNGNTIAFRTDKKGFTVFGPDFNKLDDGEYGSYLYSSFGYIEVEFESPKKYVFYTYDGKKFHEYGE